MAALIGEHWVEHPKQIKTRHRNAGQSTAIPQRVADTRGVDARVVVVTLKFYEVAYAVHVVAGAEEAGAFGQGGLGGRFTDDGVEGDAEFDDVFRDGCVAAGGASGALIADTAIDKGKI